MGLLYIELVVQYIYSESKQWILSLSQHVVYRELHCINCNNSSTQFTFLSVTMTVFVLDVASILFIACCVRVGFYTGDLHTAASLVCQFRGIRLTESGFRSIAKPVLGSMKKSIRFAEWIYSCFHCESLSGFDNRILLQLEWFRSIIYFIVGIIYRHFIVYL